MLDFGYYNMDCMEGMKQFPDKFFDLAIVDPPYGIGAGGKNFINGTSKTDKQYYKTVDWDLKRPDKKYFNKLFRVSKNQIIFGGNYFIDYLKSTKCFIVWDKTIYGNSYGDCELIWTSFTSVHRIFKQNICAVNIDGRIHPTQKPVKLYQWILKNYAKPGDRLLDTHVGSASSLIAFEMEGFNDYVGFELDTDYYKDSCAKLEKERIKMRQQTIFTPVQMRQPEQAILL